MPSLITVPLATGLSSQISSGLSNTVNSQDNDRFYARVVSVILDSSDSNWNTLGKSQAQYGVYFSRVGVEDTFTDNVEHFAYCHQTSLRRIPIKNEIVVIEKEINIEAKNTEDGYYAFRYYWTDIVPLWNHPHLNGYPDTVKDGSGTLDTGKYFKESNSINPLQLVPGDVTLEGRHGNSIRLGGTEYKDAPISKNHNGEPYIIIRAGQGTEESRGDKAIYEDVNKDGASIYLLGNGKVPLTQANTKRKACKDTAPDKANIYDGAQIVLNSDRLFLNARNKDIELSSKEGTGINAKFVHIDGQDYTSLDATKVYLGEGGIREQEPVLLGQSTVDWLKDFCTELSSYLTVAMTTTTPTQLPALATKAGFLKTNVEILKAKLEMLKSKKVFTE